MPPPIPHALHIPCPKITPIMTLAQHEANHKSSIAHVMSTMQTNPRENLHPSVNIINNNATTTVPSTSTDSNSTGQKHADDLLGKCMIVPLASYSNSIEHDGHKGKHHSMPKTKTISSTPL